MTVEERHEPAPAGPGPRPRVAGTTVSAAGRPESVPVSDGFFRTLVEAASEGVIAIDRYGTIRYLNPAAERLVGVAAREAVGRPVSAFLPAPRSGKLRRSGSIARWARRHGAIDIALRKSDGQSVPVALRAVETVADTAPLLVISLRDITKRKAAETRLKASETRLARILDIADEAVISIDADQRITLFNKGAERIFGYRAGEIIGQKLEVLLPRRFRGAHAAHVRAFGHGGVAARMMSGRDEIVGCRKDGSEFAAEASISHFQQDGEKVFTAVLRDITARKEMERALKAREALYRLLADNATDMIVRIRRCDGKRLYVSPSCVDILGYEPAELVGGFASDLTHPCDFQRLRDAALSLRSPAETRTVTHRVRRKDGRYIWAETAMRLLPDSALDGGPEIVTVTRDVSARKAIEEQLTAAKAEAERASRAKSDFLASMSHELRTPLNAIIGFADIIQSEAMGPIGKPRYVEYARDILQSGQHLLDLINDILDLIKIEAGRLILHSTEIDVADIVGLCLRMMKPRAERGGVSLSSAIADDAHRFRGDEKRFKQILLNLLSNAIKFTPPGGSVSVSAGIENGELVVTVKDTGIGIADEDQEHVMEAFRQSGNPLDPETEGTGLGLPLTKRLVELHNGSLELRSAIGVGTTVTVRFPAGPVVPHAAPS